MSDKPLATLVDGQGQFLEATTGEVLTDTYTTTGPFLVDGDGNYLQQGSGYVPTVYDSRTATFFIVEVETYKLGRVDVMLASDLGYRTKSTDPNGVQVYPHLLDTAFEIDRRVSLELSSSGTNTYGSIRIVNLNQAYDAFSVGRNSNSRAVRVKIGQKSYDPDRGMFVDPPYGSLKPVFSGACGSWLIGEDVIEIPLKDATYLIDKSIQTRLFLGTGGTEGPSAFAGLPKPMVRGGSPQSPVCNVPFKLVDTVYNIWQWTDGPGSVVALYENSAPVFTYAGDVGDPIAFYTSATPPGSYRTANTFGLMQLGSTSVGIITGDVTGSCGGLFVSNAIALAQSILLYDLSLPAAMLNTASFAYADIAYSFTAGFFLDSDTSGLAVVQRLVNSVGGRLLSSRSGSIGVFVPPRTQLGAVPDARWDVSNVVSITPTALPSTIDPPPYRWRVSYQTCYSVQQSGYNTTITDERKQFVANQNRYALWYGSDVQADWLRPNDPAPIDTYLLRQVDAQQLADTLGDQWRLLPNYYDIVVPITAAVGLDIGSYVSIKWPLGILTAGAIGQIYGEQPRSTDSVVTFEVLVNTAEISIDQFDGEFVLDVSQLNVGILGDTVVNTDFYLDVSLLDVGTLAAGGTVVKSTLDPSGNGGVSFGSSLGGGVLPSTGGSNVSGVNSDNAFILDASYLDIGVLGTETAPVTIISVSPPPVSPPAIINTPTTPPIVLTPTPPPPSTTLNNVYFTLDVSQLDVDVLGA